MPALRTGMARPTLVDRRGLQPLDPQAGDAGAEQKSRVGLCQSPGLRRGRAGPEQQVEAELERVVARARVAVGGEAEGGARAYDRGRDLLHLEPVVAEQRAD